MHPDVGSSIRGLDPECVKVEEARGGICACILSLLSCRCDQPPRAPAVTSPQWWL